MLHHLAAIYTYKFYANVNYHTWYLMLPAAYHSVINTFPSLWINNYIYGVSFLLFVVVPAFTPNMRRTKNHKHLIASVFILLPSLTILATGNCVD